MKIIDIHTHVYPEIRGISEGMYFASKGYGICKHGNEDVQFLPPSFVKSNSPVEVHRAYMKWLGIDQALLMANTLYGYYNDYISESVKKYPDVYRGVAFVEPFRGEASVQELAKVYEEGVLFGMKLPHGRTHDRYAHGTLLGLFEQCRPACIHSSFPSFRCSRYPATGTAVQEHQFYYLSYGC